MRLKKFTASLLLLVVCSPWISAQVPRGPQDMQTKTITLNKATFDQSLKNAVGPKVMGYQYVLIKDGRLVTEGAGGLARTSADGSPMMMTVKTPINLGSLQKFITGTALLNMMEHPTNWSPGKNYSLRNRLDMPIWGQFPSLWVDLIPSSNVPCPQIRCIKYRQLLQHRTGFNDLKQPDASRNVLGFLGDNDGFLASQYDKRQYSNINFVLAGYLLPVYEKTHFANEIMANAVQYTNLTQADDYVRNQLGKRFDQILNERIFSKMNPKINPSCDATNELKNTVAYGYATKTDTNPGVISSQIEKKGHCTGEGGYYMSARDFANYAAHFSASNLIVSQEGRDAMFKEGMPFNDRLVWSSANSDDWMETHFKMPVIVWSNGIPKNGRTVLIRLPQNHYLILFTNSNEMTVNDLYDAGVAAFKDGMEHNFE
jgi:CubicO group peptidase (beta-lactamase class C family)